MRGCGRRAVLRASLGNKHLAHEPSLRRLRHGGKAGTRHRHGRSTLTTRVDYAGGSTMIKPTTCGWPKTRPYPEKMSCGSGITGKVIVGGRTLRYGSLLWVYLHTSLLTEWLA